MFEFIFALANAKESQTPNSPLLKIIRVLDSHFQHPSVMNREDSKLINGQQAPSGAFPFIVSLGLISQAGYFHRCGASIVKQQFIMTAAHCVKDLGNNYEPNAYYQANGKYLVIIAGSDTLDPSQGYPETKIYLIQKISYNTNYTSITEPYDMAILKTSELITFNTRVKPIKLPTTFAAAVYGKLMTVLGWGVTETGSISLRLLMTNLTAINKIDTNGECAGLNTKFYCMKDLTSVQSNACYGDSGGPLIYNVNNEWVLYGLVSFGYSDSNNKCINTYPSFFTMVPRLLSWANSQMSIL